MKRNTRFSSSLFSDIVFVAVCLVCACLSFQNFWYNLNKSLTKLDSEPIAVITFKYHTAQRKFMERVVWDRLRQNSPVYDGDTVRIAPQSEATVYFTDGNIIDLSENTLAQLFLKKNAKAKVNVNSGTVSVTTSGSGMQIQAGKSVVDVRGSSSVNTASDGALNVVVTDGTASVAAGGETTEVAAGKALTVTESGNTEEPLVTVLAPAHNSRILNYDTTPLTIPFTCRYTGTQKMKAMIELSEDSAFTSPDRKTFDSIEKTSVQVAAGSRWWKLYLIPADGVPSGKPAAAGKFTVLYSPVPDLISPAKGYSAKFRTKLPAVRFIWTANEWATSYQLEISDNKEMKNPVITQRCPQDSSIISSIGEGTWYWRVVPYYTIDNIGLAYPSDVYSFRIIKSGELVPPVPVQPAPESLVNSSEKSEKNGFAFSWKNNPEAVSYTVSVSKNSDMSKPLFSVTGIDNYFTPDNVKEKIANGEWYWQVALSDNEGNKSLSPVIHFYVVDSELFQRTIFPPDGYRLSQARTQDIKYVWKTNVPAETRFQISTASDFTECLIDSGVSATSFAGRSIAPGTYFWRVKSEMGRIEMKTPAKTLIVEGPMPKPDCVLPPEGGRAVIRPAAPFKFQWKEVEEADYYQIKIYAASDTERTKPVYQKNLIEGTEYKIDMEDFAERQYVWTVQGFREETPLASRASGQLGVYPFTLKKLKPVALLTPAARTHLEGVQAIRMPGKAEWSTVESLAESEFVIYKDSVAEDNVIFRVKNPPVKVQLPRLYEGTYYWTVNGRTYDDLDISALKPNMLTVGAVEKLARPSGGSPENKTVFGVEYLKKSRELVFRWNSVKGADRYVFRILRKGSGMFAKDEPVIEQTFPANVNSFDMKDLAVLARGSFIWTVEGQSLFEGDLFQNGVPLERSFEIDLPKLSAPAMNGTGLLYGR